MNYERLNNVSVPLIFRKSIPAGAKGYIDIPITAHGYITECRINFAAGEAGTLHLRPVVILPGEIMLDLFKYANGGDAYISGDDETIISSMKMEIENHTVARVFYENHGEPGTANSQLNVDITVNYLSIIEPENVIGPRSRG